MPEKKSVVNSVDRLAVFVSRHETMKTRYVYVWNTVYEYPHCTCSCSLSQLRTTPHGRASLVSIKVDDRRGARYGVARMLSWVQYCTVEYL